MIRRVSLALVFALPVAAQTPIPAGEWPAYHRDLAGTRYSPLDQITPANIGRVKIAWTYAQDTSVGRPEGRSQNTPLMVGGVLYFSAGSQRAVVAADAATGKQLWAWRMDEGPRAAASPRPGAGRGVSYWTDGREARIFVTTPGFQLVALDAKTGKPVATFGNQGVVDLKAQLGFPDLDLVRSPIGASSPPLVFEDVVVIGPALEVGLRPRSMKNVTGRVLAIDARTGALKWRFNTIPVKGEFGYETWENGSAEYTGNTGAWAPLSLDTRRGYLYLPVEAATGDYYGGHRLGDNLFSSTLVCVDVRTGKRIWHQQIIHHDIWDRDIPTAPILADITVNGQRVEAVAQITKQAYLYVYDRVTGKPVWPIVEKPVPPSDVPGERASPTQPVPSKPAPFDVQAVTIDNLINFTPALRAQAVELVKQYRLGDVFTPPSLRAAPDSTRGTLSLPGTVGGANWEHGAFDPETGMIYIGSFTNVANMAMVKDPNSDMNFSVAVSVPTVSGLPLIKPPYSRITAIDLNKGDHVWMAVNGDTPARFKSNPALAGLTIPPTGSTTRPVILATKTLLVTGEGNGGAAFVHVLDKKTGAKLADIPVPGAVTSQPMSYAVNGRQYIAMWVSSTGGGGSQLITFTLDGETGPVR
jgi:quinoprotein glucose dehydrogenase